MNELYHYGILGMRWGVRRTPEQLGRAAARRKSGGSLKKAISEKVARKSKASEELKFLSDDELRSRINRLQMEENYINLLARSKERGRGAVSRVMSKLGDQILSKAIEAAATKAVKTAFKTKEGEKGAKKVKLKVNSESESSKESKTPKFNNASDQYRYGKASTAKTQEQHDYEAEQRKLGRTTKVKWLI